MKQYLISVYQPDGPPPPPEILDTIMAGIEAIRAELKDAGSWVFSGGLHAPSTATVLRPKDGDRAAVLGAEDVFDLRGRRGRRGGHQSPASPWNGRTSMGRPVACA